MSYRITIAVHKGRYQIFKNGVLQMELNKYEYNKLKEALRMKEFERRTKDELPNVSI